MSFKYIASPYSADCQAVMNDRYDSVVRASAALAAAGELLYSPIASWHVAACRHSMPRGVDFWWKLDEAMIRASSELWVLLIDGWRESVGVQKEIAFALEIGKPVKYVAEVGTGYMSTHFHPDSEEFKKELDVWHAAAEQKGGG